MIAAITQDALVLRNLGRLGETVDAKSFDALPRMTEPPAAVVIDLDVPDALPIAAQARSLWENALIAGFLSYPNRKLWDAAQAAGYDLVTTRGALASQLKEKLEHWQGRAKQRIRICDVGDLAGRLGVIARLDDLPMGPVAVYHIAGEVYATQDRCPHAGARISEGDLSGAVITCPGHGSQFDVRTGERLRAPSEFDLQTFRVEIDGGQVFLVKDEG